MEETAAQKRIRELFLIVTRNDNHGALLRFDRLTGFVYEKLHTIDFDQQIIGEFDIRFVDFVNQKDDLLIGLEGLPQLALFDVVGNIMDSIITQLRITQARHRVVLVQTLLSFGCRLDVPLNQTHAQAGCDFLR